MRFTGTLFVETALLSSGWASGVRVEIDPGGIIGKIESGANPATGDHVLKSRALLPAPANVHSHAFQRAMAGLTEYRSKPGDNFWSWRNLMFRFVTRLTPEDAEALAALVQMEMLEAGYAVSGEFHYLHHQPDGAPYGNYGEMGGRMVAAAQRSGIGLTLLPVLYRYGGLDQRPLKSGQLRFGSTPDIYEKIVASCQTAIAELDADSRIAVAPHSLRAVSAEDLAWAEHLLPDAPIHIHIAEQTGEVAEVEAAYGARPIAWLLDNAEVSKRWCLIHATHMTAAETLATAKTGAVAGLCPITESNLGDGIFPGPGFLSAGGTIGIGSDSNVRISLGEELRTLEYSQRLRDRARAVLTCEHKSVGRSLFDVVANGGARALGRKSGKIETGYFADLMTLDVSSIHTSGLGGDNLLDAWIFAGDDTLVRDVFSAGRYMVADGHHRARSEIMAAAVRVLGKLRSDL